MFGKDVNAMVIWVNHTDGREMARVPAFLMLRMIPDSGIPNIGHFSDHFPSFYIANYSNLLGLSERKSDFSDFSGDCL